MSEPLLATKLYSPQLPSRVIQRRSLLELLESGRSPDKRLILISAPAGYGKTTLVCDWLQNVSHSCWLSLEKGDNDVRIFFTYLVASLQKAFPELFVEAQELLEIPQLPPLQAVLTSIVNDLASIEEDFVVILDDYQSIRMTIIHDGVAFLLDHLPPNKHIVITTRADPALPLHRYRSRQQMVEIRAEDLRFSIEEVSRYMQGIGDIPLNDYELATLETRTEGWVAGLQMAAISLRRKQDKELFIHALAGTNRFILDYLVEEVLSTQPDTVQRFLMETAILNRLCASLCEALTKIGEDASQEILQNLERANLFIIPLDDERSWYRYHHLFQDLLVMRLKQSLPEKLNSLHRSAADWYESHGWMSEAVQHSIEGANFERAADLVEQHTLQLFGQGKLDQLVGWIRKLPTELSARRPWLTIYQAWALAFAGNIPEAQQMIETTIDNLEDSKPSPHTQKKLMAEIHAIRGVLFAMSGNHQGVLALAGMLDGKFPPESLFARSALLWSIGYACRMDGQLERAATAFQEMLKIGRQIDNLWTLATGFADLGMVLRLSGRLQDADTAYREGLQIMRQAGANGLGFVGRLESFLANTLYEQEKVDEAAQLIADSIRHNQLWNNPNHLAHAYFTEARIQFTQDEDAAELALKSAEAIAAHASLVASLRAGIEALRIRFWLTQGRLEEANHWADSHPLSDKTPPPNVEAFDIYVMARARIWIAQGNFLDAWKLLQELETSARSGGRNNTLIETLILMALAAPKPATALDCLESALELGVPKGYRRIFLDEGEKLTELLSRLRGRSALIGPLLGDKTNKSRLEGLLTARELEILRAMAEGLSNKEIGRKLFVSQGTVKAHSAAIYRKLEVVNRAGAIARAKDLNLL